MGLYLLGLFTPALLILGIIIVMYFWVVLREVWIQDLKPFLKYIRDGVVS
jgi:hypothetical protein